MPWDLIGNAKTNEQIHFVGTTDQHALVIRTNGKEALRVDASGNVEMGTTQNPTKVGILGNWDGQKGALSLTGDKPTIKLAGGPIAGNQSWILHVGSDGPGSLEMFTQGAGQNSWTNMMTLTPSGNVGIGTNTPHSKVEVAATDGNALAIDGSQAYITLRDGPANGYKPTRIQTVDGNLQFTTANALVGNPANPTPALEITKEGTVQVRAQDALQIAGYQPFITLSDGPANGYKPARIQTVDGNLQFTAADALVGNPANPTPALEITKEGTVQIRAQDALQIAGYQPFITLSDSGNADKAARIQNADGNIIFYTSFSLAQNPPTPAMTITDGNVVVHGGDIVLTGADCAEEFDTVESQICEPGTVMVIKTDGSLACSRDAYDKRVAGVVSGAGQHKPGIILDKQHSNEERLPIALVGKVYCKVDAAHSPIEVGDLLTTSPTPGHAMKAQDSAKAFGAVIGKALRSRATGQGLIPILIALQ